MITVTISQGNVDNPVLAKDRLPVGYSYVVDDELSTPIEPILLWLASAYPPKQGMWRPATVEAAAYDLCDWWRFLGHERRQWDEVTSDDVANYRDGLLNTICVRQKKSYDPKTIGRRLRAVGAFYEWASRRGYFHGEAVSPKTLRMFVRRIDQDALAHTGSTVYHSVHALVPRQGTDADERVSPLTSTEWRDVASALGPLPSQQGTHAGLSRDRLASETSLWTGMRVDEVAGLTVHQILDLSRVALDASTVVIDLTRTKGLRKRKVLLPQHLVTELIAYIDGERAEAVTVGRRYGLKKAPAALFLNGSTARNHAGKPAQPYTLSEAFRRAVEAVGLTRRVERVDPDTRNEFISDVPAHTFHDLRHTFAVFLYQAEVASGNVEPWKIVQARLGHKHLKTTTDIYLRIVDIFRIKANDAVYRFLRTSLGT